MAGTPVINCRIQTIAGMAMKLADSWLQLHDLSFLNAKRAVFLVDITLGKLQTSFQGYFSKLPPGITLSSSVASSISTLRLAGIHPDQLRPEHFNSDTKHDDFLSVFQGYVRSLRENRFVDYADVLEITAKLLQESSELFSPQKPFLILTDGLELSPLEKRLIDEFPSDLVIRISAGHDQEAFSSKQETEEELITRSILSNREDRPYREMDFFSALGEINEVREILRRCLRDEIPFDQVEIIHTDTETYVPLIYETILQFLPEPSFDTQDLPATFAEGLPASYSRPAKALQGWIAWMREGYPQARLVHMIEEGLLVLGPRDSEASFLELGQALRSVRIGLGKAKYLGVIQRWAGQDDLESRSLDHWDHDAQGTSNDHGDSEGPIPTGSENLLSFLERLIEISDFSYSSARECVQNVKVFVSQAARSANEFDNYARLAILEELESLLSFLNAESDSVTFDVWDWVDDMAGQIRILGSGPKPGCLHVSHLSSGGHSGRQNIFIVGLDDQRFPHTRSGDPLLLDDERQKISSSLATSHRNRYREIQNLSALFARQTGKMTLSYSCKALQDDSPRFPSNVILTTLGVIHEGSSVGASDLSTLFSSPVSFIPQDEKSCCSVEEWLMRKAIERGGEDVKIFLHECFPHIERGFIACAARASDTFTAFDGKLEHAPRVLDPTSLVGPVLSTSMLETMAKCPLSYFFKYILRIQEPDEPGMDTSQWLDHLGIGRLLHEIFHVHILELMAEARLPLADRDAPRLFRILNHHVERYRRLYPPPSLSFFERQKRLLSQACRVFLVEEEIACRSVTPRFAEISIGLSPGDRPSEIDQETAEEIEIAPGRVVRIRGRVDRIDEESSERKNAFIVWDYKTGGTYRYRTSDTFHQGRNLQHAIYIAMASALLKKKISPEARVTRFGYYFPGSQSRGIRLMITSDVVDGGLSIVDTLCSMMADGTFPATNNSKEDCTFCDYATICGDIETVAAQSRSKLNNFLNAKLEKFRLLREEGAHPG
jgi:ATP-dependent helicase/nuclease subunit B